LTEATAGGAACKAVRADGRIFAKGAISVWAVEVSHLDVRQLGSQSRSNLQPAWGPPVVALAAARQSTGSLRSRGCEHGYPDRVWGRRALLTFSVQWWPASWPGRAGRMRWSLRDRSQPTGAVQLIAVVQLRQRVHPMSVHRPCQPSFAQDTYWLISDRSTKHHAFRARLSGAGGVHDPVARSSRRVGTRHRVAVTAGDPRSTSSQPAAAPADRPIHPRSPSPSPARDHRLLCGGASTSSADQSAGNRCGGG